eukprot:624596-Pleurochrysis_carterae.AAC.1
MAIRFFSVDGAYCGFARRHLSASAAACLSFICFVLCYISGVNFRSLLYLLDEGTAPKAAQKAA